ncbi:MAG TPA: 50S ribosomal protein L9 [Thermoanaerobaculia bacterium]|jgi:large subunit ribosomal protein L9|nr:50S ribosomal protein L9 [Thermoanaerobaculia bacterium]
MKVILTDEIRGLGTRGDVVTVKDGYARNFLIPKNLAREATAGNMKAIEQEKKKWAQLGQQERAIAQKAADSVKGTKVTIQKRVGDHGNLFGSVTANEIADALAAKGIDVDKRRIELDHAIKTVGVHEIDVRLHRDVTAHIQVEVVPTGTAKVEEAPAPAAPPPAAAEASE